MSTRTDRSTKSNVHPLKMQISLRISVFGTRQVLTLSTGRTVVCVDVQAALS